MPLRPYQDKFPVVDATAYVDEMSVVIGDVVLGAHSSIWPMCAVRGDVNHIRIGAHTNIQDGTIVHVTSPHPKAPQGIPTLIGNRVTVGHRCVLHGCIVEDLCLIGMSSTVLDRAIVRSGAMLGAGSLVTEGSELEGGYLWMGRPAKRVRPLSNEEKAMLAHLADHYAALKEHYRQR